MNFVHSDWSIEQEHDAIFTAPGSEYCPPFSKMASRFAEIGEQEIAEMKENAVPLNTKQATKFGMNIFKGM